MRISHFVAAGLMLSLAGCQTYQYQSMGFGPPFELAQAQCNIGAMGTQQQIAVFGTPNYVATQQFINDMGNINRREAFMRDCMILQGWRQVPVTTGGAPRQGTKGKNGHPGLPAVPNVPKQS